MAMYGLGPVEGRKKAEGPLFVGEAHLQRVLDDVHGGRGRAGRGGPVLGASHDLLVHGGPLLGGIDDLLVRGDRAQGRLIRHVSRILHAARSLTLLKFKVDATVRLKREPRTESSLQPVDP